MSRGEALKVTQQRKLDDAFTGRTFEIVKEIHLPYGQVFVTAFGNKARHGFILRDTETGERIVVGRRLLRHIADRYQGLTLPAGRRRQPTPG